MNSVSIWDDFIYFAHHVTYRSSRSSERNREILFSLQDYAPFVSPIFRRLARGAAIVYFPFQLEKNRMAFV